MKKLLLTSLCLLGVHRFARWWNRKRVIILCYHGITENSQRYPKGMGGQDVFRDDFAAQLDYLHRHYKVISLDEYVAACRTGLPLSQHSVVLTFDDGVMNFATVAAPMMAERLMPSTVFVITDTLTASEQAARTDACPASDDERYLSWREAIELARRGLVQIGSHTCSHPNLLQLSALEAAREMNESRSVICQRLQKDEVAFAYPYGKFSAALAERAREQKYQCALTIEGGYNGPESDLFSLHRNVISHEDRGLLFAARVSGLTCWLSKLMGKLTPNARSASPLFGADASTSLCLNNAASKKHIGSA